MADAPEMAGLKKLFTPRQISTRIKQLARKIDEIYSQEPLVVICVLKGAFIFFSDLVRFLHNKNLEVDFVRLSSYGNNTNSLRRLVVSKDVEISVDDKHVLIVEDIVDSGRSMRFLLERLAKHKVRSLRLAALIDKHERREVEVNVDFAAFHVGRGFVVGYGLDHAERWRALPAVYEIIVE
jgi:hypoxanthine phosphoribosyltransferase